MATKKQASKQSWKADNVKVSTQPHEILYVRRSFQRVIDSRNIIHPSALQVKALIKKHRNSRKKIYVELRAIGYEKVRIK